MPASTSLIRLHAALTDAATEPDSLPEIIVVRGFDWPEWLSWLVFAGLIGALIIAARRPHQPESSLLARQGFRTLLAAAAGWLAAAIVIAAEEWLFPIPSPTGVAVSGLIFGASVMAPVLDEPSKHPLRYLLLLLAGMATQLVLWGIGVGSFEWLSERDGVSPAFAAIQFVPGVISVMACYFIMTIALWRIASLIPTVRLGTGLFLLGCICGVFLTIAVLDVWQSFFELDHNSSLAAFVQQVAYAVWFALTSVCLNLAKARPLRRFGIGDLFWLTMTLVCLVAVWHLE